MTKSEVQAILDDADVNNDGKLDYSEVHNYLQTNVCCLLRPPQMRKPCCGHKCFPVCARTQHLLRTLRCICCVRDAKYVSEFYQKHFASATNAREMFLGLRGKEAKHSFAHRGNITSNNVSATMFPHLWGPLGGL